MNVNGYEICQSAHLPDADLQGANLEGANLEDADLQGARLQGAHLWDANLMAADLEGANLTGADLRDVDLDGADLEGAILVSVNLQGADLSGTNFRSAIGIVRLDMVDPREYQPVAVAHADGWWIASGCRWFALADALLHWESEDYDGYPKIAARYIRALNALPECPTRYIKPARTP